MEKAIWERKVSKRKMYFVNEQEILLLPEKKSEANQDYGICSFTGSSSGRAEVTAAQAQKRLSAAHAPQHWRSPLEGAVEGVRDLAPFLGGGKSEWSLEGLAESQN